MPALHERLERKQQASKDTGTLSSERFWTNLRTLHNVHANPSALCFSNQQQAGNSHVLSLYASLCVRWNDMLVAVGGCSLSPAAVERSDSSDRVSEI